MLSERVPCREALKPMLALPLKQLLALKVRLAEPEPEKQLLPLKVTLAVAEPE
jgi:hypothetical protein